jgi:hypothetical protein
MTDHKDSFLVERLEVNTGRRRRWRLEQKQRKRLV